MTTRTYTDSDGTRFTVEHRDTEGRYTWRMSPETPIPGAYYEGATLEPFAAAPPSGIRVMVTPRGATLPTKTIQTATVTEALSVTAAVLKQVPVDPAVHHAAMQAWITGAD